MGRDGDGAEAGEDGSGTTIISTATKGAAQYTAYVNQWGVLGGIEQAYGLPFLGNAATPSTNGRLPLP